MKLLDAVNTGELPVLGPPRTVKVSPTETPLSREGRPPTVVSTSCAVITLPTGPGNNGLTSAPAAVVDVSVYEMDESALIGPDRLIGKSKLNAKLCPFTRVPAEALKPSTGSALPLIPLTPIVEPSPSLKLTGEAICRRPPSPIV